LTINYKTFSAILLGTVSIRGKVYSFDVFTSFFMTGSASKAVDISRCENIVAFFTPRCYSIHNERYFRYLVYVSYQFAVKTLNKASMMLYKKYNYKYSASTFSWRINIHLENYVAITYHMYVAIMQKVCFKKWTHCVVYKKVNWKGLYVFFPIMFTSCVMLFNGNFCKTIKAETFLCSKTLVSLLAV